MHDLHHSVSWLPQDANCRFATSLNRQFQMRLDHGLSTVFTKFTLVLGRDVPKVDFHEFVGGLDLTTCGRRCPQRIICGHYASFCCVKKYLPAAPLPPHHTLAPRADQTTGLKNTSACRDHHRLPMSRFLKVETTSRMRAVLAGTSGRSGEYDD